jgi:hypothetical protein
MSGQLDSSRTLDNPELTTPLSITQASEEIGSDFSLANPDWLAVLGLCPARARVDRHKN